MTINEKVAFLIEELKQTLAQDPDAVMVLAIAVSKDGDPDFYVEDRLLLGDSDRIAFALQAISAGLAEANN